MLKRFLAALVLVGGVAGCAQVSDFISGDDQRATRVACRAYSGTLNVLAQFRVAGKLSDAQVDAVNDSIEVVKPICSAPVAPTGAEVVAQVTKGLGVLLDVEDAVQGDNS